MAARISTVATKLVSVANLSNESGWKTLEAKRNTLSLVPFYKMYNDFTPILVYHQLYLVQFSMPQDQECHTGPRIPHGKVTKTY